MFATVATVVRFVAHRARKFRIIKEKKRLLSDIYVSANCITLRDYSYKIINVFRKSSRKLTIMQ